MRKKYRSIAQSSRSSTKEPLAEGLQIIVPIDSQGRRLLRKMPDEELVAYAKKIMKENGVVGRFELRNTDRGLYYVLRKKGLLDKVGFEERRRQWDKVSDAEIVEIVKRVMKDRKIYGKKELRKVDSGLYDILTKRGLIGDVGFARKRRSWTKMSDEEIIELARKLMEENKISGKKELRDIDGSLYQVLTRRGLLDDIGFVRKKRSWIGMSDDEIVEATRRFMKRKGIRWKKDLEKADRGLYEVLIERKLLGKIAFDERYRSWRDMSDEEIVEYARELMEREGITGRKELYFADRGTYNILRERALIDRAFARIDEQRNNHARDAVIDALDAFGAANDNSSSEDDVA